MRNLRGSRGGSIRRSPLRPANECGLSDNSVGQRSRDYPDPFHAAQAGMGQEPRGQGVVGRRARNALERRVPVAHDAGRKRRPEPLPCGLVLKLQPGKRQATGCAP